MSCANITSRKKHPRKPSNLEEAGIKCMIYLPVKLNLLGPSDGQPCPGLGRPSRSARHNRWPTAMDRLTRIVVEVIGF